LTQKVQFNLAKGLGLHSRGSGDARGRTETVFSGFAANATMDMTTGVLLGMGSSKTLQRLLGACMA
jgi:hypothetical protein